MTGVQPPALSVPARCGLGDTETGDSGPASIEARASMGGDLWRTGVEAATLARDVQTVVALRVASFALSGVGMAGRAGGARAEAADEWHRMIDEKPRAFAEALLAMSFAAFGAQRPDQIAAIGLRPLQSRVTENMARLRGTARDPDAVQGAVAVPGPTASPAPPPVPATDPPPAARAAPG